MVLKARAGMAFQQGLQLVESMDSQKFRGRTRRADDLRGVGRDPPPPPPPPGLSASGGVERDAAPTAARWSFKNSKTTGMTAFEWPMISGWQCSANCPYAKHNIPGRRVCSFFAWAAATYRGGAP